MPCFKRNVCRVTCFLKHIGDCPCFHLPCALNSMLTPITCFLRHKIGEDWHGQHNDYSLNARTAQSWRSGNLIATFWSTRSVTGAIFRRPFPPQNDSGYNVRVPLNQAFRLRTPAHELGSQWATSPDYLDSGASTTTCICLSGRFNAVPGARAPARQQQTRVVESELMRQIWPESPAWRLRLSAYAETEGSGSIRSHA